MALDGRRTATYSRVVTQPAVSHAQKQRILLGITLRVGAMAFLAGLSAIVKWTGERGIPVFEIILFRNLFAFVPLGLYIWRTTGFEVLKTRRPLGHLTRSVIGLTGMVCGFSTTASTRTVLPNAKRAQ